MHLVAAQRHVVLHLGDHHGAHKACRGRRRIAIDLGASGPRRRQLLQHQLALRRDNHAPYIDVLAAAISQPQRLGEGPQARHQRRVRCRVPRQRGEAALRQTAGAGRH